MKPDDFEMDAPEPEDFGKEKVLVLWDFFENFPLRRGISVSEETPGYFIEDGVLYKTSPRIINDIDTGIN